MYGGEINMTTYIKFLEGKFRDKRMFDVQYDNVTVSFTDNLFYGYVFLQNETAMFWNPNHTISFRSTVRKCFTIDAPDIEQNLNWFFGMYISNDIFPHGRRPGPSDVGGFLTYLHYPGQRFTSYYSVKTGWELKTNNSQNYIMYFTMKNIDVITRRNKPHKTCFEDWKNYDRYIMDRIMTEAKCRPSHWTTTLNLPLCSNATAMKNFKWQPSTAQIEIYGPPCKVIERLDYTYHEKDEKEDLAGM